MDWGGRAGDGGVVKGAAKWGRPGGGRGSRETVMCDPHPKLPS